MLPSVPIFPVYNFFRQNIWHSIFDQFHFHHVFGDEMTVSSDKTGKGTSRPPFGSWRVLFLGTSWMAIRERSFKYLDAQQVSQQISIFFKSKFHNEWASVKKAILRFLSDNGPIYHPQKFQPSQTPIHVFSPYLHDFWQITDADIFIGPRSNHSLP